MACGPKCQIFLLIISVWGILFFVPMGGLFYVQSATLFNDLPVTVDKAHNWTAEGKQTFVDNVADLYVQTAYRCWGAAALYGCTVVLAGLRLLCVKNRLRS